MCLNAAAIAATQRFEAFCSSIRTALATGLSLAMSVDLLYEHALIDAIRAVLRMKSFTFATAACFSKCQVPELLFLWLFYAGIAWFIQNSLNGQMLKWMRSGVTPSLYQPLSTSKTESRGPEAQQKTFSYPDALEFNFFDPDSLPEILQPYADTVFDTVQMLAAQYGFQVDNSRNQAEHLLMWLANEGMHTPFSSLTHPLISHSPSYTKLTLSYDKQSIKQSINQTKAPATMATYPTLPPACIPSYLRIIANGVIVWAPPHCLVSGRQGRHMRLI